MSPHGYWRDGRPVLVATIPVGDDPATVERSNQIARRGWLDWVAACDNVDQLPALVAAATVAGVTVDEVAATLGIRVEHVEAMIGEVEGGA